MGAVVRMTKMHGIGNDYVYVDCFAPAGRRIPPRWRARVSPAPHRHRLRRPDPDLPVRRSPTAAWRCTTPTAAAARCAATASAASPSTSTTTACARQPDAHRDRRRREDARSSTLDAAGRVERRHRRHGRADPRRAAHPGRRRGPRHRPAARGRRHDATRSPASRWATRTASSSSPRSTTLDLETHRPAVRAPPVLPEARQHRVRRACARPTALRHAGLGARLRRDRGLRHRRLRRAGRGGAHRPRRAARAPSISAAATSTIEWRAPTTTSA